MAVEARSSETGGDAGAANDVAFSLVTGDPLCRALLGLLRSE